MVMKNYNEMTPAQKAMMRERIVKEASKLTGEERKKYIESLKGDFLQALAQIKTKH
jgi:hypothetical protein